MTYERHKIDASALERILGEAAKSAFMAKHPVNFRGYLEQASSYWAIDPERGNFLITHSTRTTREGGHEYYFFHSEGVWYEIYLNDMFSNQCGFCTSSVPGKEDRARLEQEITDAFAVFGTFGFGPEPGWDLPLTFLADEI
ncbi:MAG: hypothetical protein ACJ8GW_11715 [Massilia sp.]